jgi:hypothetical protein
MNLIDDKKLINRDVECRGKNFPVSPDVFNAVSLLQTEIEAEKITVACTTPPGTKRMNKKIARIQCRCF